MISIVSKDIIHYLHNPIIHLYYPTKLLRLQFLLGHENVPREVENNAYADFFFLGWGEGGGGLKEVYYGICASSEWDSGGKLICIWHPLGISQ